MLVLLSMGFIGIVDERKALRVIDQSELIALY